MLIIVPAILTEIRGLREIYETVLQFAVRFSDFPFFDLRDLKIHRKCSSEQFISSIIVGVVPESNSSLSKKRLDGASALRAAMLVAMLPAHARRSERFFWLCDGRPSTLSASGKVALY